MLNIKSRILEGVNLYSKNTLVFIRVEDNFKEMYKILQEYRKLDKILKLNSEIRIKDTGDILEILISSEDVNICSFIIEALVRDEAVEDIIQEIKKRKDLDWSYKLRELALREEIPYMKIDENEVQLGYGINLLRINKHDYVEVYSENDEQIIEKVKKNNKGIIPIISVSGTNGKTTTVRLIHNILLSLGYKSGLSSTGGIYIGKKVIKHGDTTGFYSAREVLKDKTVDAAVLETARGGILKKGLGYKKAKVAIITSISEDHIGMENINSINDLADIKAVIADELADDGIIVIKAIPILIDKFKDRENVILFDDSKSELIDAHIKSGGKAFYVKDRCIVENDKGIEKEIVNIKEIPFTFNGISKSNVRNIIAAIIATAYISNNLDKVIDCVKNLKCDIYTNLGRQNIIKFDGFNMIIDYGHNSESFNEVFSIAKSLAKKNIIGVITAPGDRKDTHIKELGQIAAKFCDSIIIKEQPDLRGRSVGETAELLRLGALKEGFDDKKIKVILGEEEAILESLNDAKEGDIIVSFSQFLYLTIPVINAFRKERDMNIIGENLDLCHKS